MGIPHILSAGQFSTSDIEEVFQTAQEMAGALSGMTLHDPETYTPKFRVAQVLQGKTLACLFYEPSTRTSSSFIAAISKLGGHCIPITQGVQFSSISKGETLEDTILTLGQYADAIVLRHPETGAAKRAAKVSPVPIINAGDGIGEHPTQALLDLFTVKQEMGRVHNLKVAFVGDLAHGRTVHSLIELLNRYEGNTFSLISPWLLRLDRGVLSPEEDCLYNRIRDKITQAVHVVGGLVEATSVLQEADVLYMTRVQRERFQFDEAYREVKDSCLLTPELVAMMKPTARILHPLPRVNEIPREIDSDPRAAYFRQVRAGLHVRMALLARVMGG